MTSQSPRTHGSSRGPEKGGRRLERVTAACDLCKRRKVKCDGRRPCAYCQRKNRADTCAFTISNKQRDQLRSAGDTTSCHNLPNHHHLITSSTCSSSNHTCPGSPPGLSLSLSSTVRRHEDNDDDDADDGQEDTVVPLEGRILRDAQGKLIFIGDCAPLSFLQTVRHLVASDMTAIIEPEVVRPTAVEHLHPHLHRHTSTDNTTGNTTGTPTRASITVAADDVAPLVEAYVVSTSALVDVFERDQLLGEIKAWSRGMTSSSSSSSHHGHVDDSAAASAAPFFLVLAIGAQESREAQAEAWYMHALNLLLKNLVASMNASTVQGFALVALYMLRAFQPNGAYLYFSLAARTAYAIGLHRTEVNASFGEGLHKMRDRMWKSLRVLDMLISNLLGRPPSTSDVDCTVTYMYHVSDVSSDVSLYMLDASVQIFIIIERVVVEVYSRKRISLRIANYVSRQLKGWAGKWLRPLTDTTARASVATAPEEDAVGACSTLCSYFYSIMLLTRPFLIYELYEYMGASMKGKAGTQGEHREKQKYADAALDAAASLVDTLQILTEAGTMPLRMPLIVSWLFTAALVLAVGGLGRSGAIFDEHCRTSIRCLDYFGKVDPHARQYSLIVQSLLRTITAHVRKRELLQRSQRKNASSRLFGLLPSENVPQPTPLEESALPEEPSSTASGANTGLDSASTAAPSDWTIYDSDFFALPWLNENDQGLQDFLQPATHTLDGASVADIPLFPLYDQQMGGSFV